MDCIPLEITIHWQFNGIWAWKSLECVRLPYEGLSWLYLMVSANKPQLENRITTYSRGGISVACMF